MHPGQEFGCRLLAPLQHRHSVSVSFHLQTGVSFPPVRVDHTAWLDGFSDEGLQAGGGGIPDPTQSDAADGPPFFLAGYTNQSLCLRLPPANPFPPTHRCRSRPLPPDRGADHAPVAPWLAEVCATMSRR